MVAAITVCSKNTETAVRMYKKFSLAVKLFVTAQ